MRLIAESEIRVIHGLIACIPAIMPANMLMSPRNPTYVVYHIVVADGLHVITVLAKKEKKTTTQNAIKLLNAWSDPIFTSMLKNTAQ